MLAGNTDCRRSVIIAQRELGSDLEVFPTAGGDSGNPREFWEKRSGESGNIHPVSCHCRPHYMCEGKRPMCTIRLRTCTQVGIVAATTRINRSLDITATRS